MYRVSAPAAIALALFSTGAPVLAAIPSYIPSNEVDVRLDVSTAIRPGSQVVGYAYVVRSLPDSRQNVYNLILSYEAAISSAAAPQGWSSDDMTRGHWSFGVGFNGLLIRPGQSLGPLVLESAGLPAVEAFFAQGDAPVPLMPGSDVSEQDYKAFLQALTWQKDSFKGYTVAPGPVTTSSPVASIVSFLAAQKEKAAGLGWIDNGGVVNSLDVKLDAAQRALSRGDTKAARGELAAFENEVKAQSGKHLDGNAVAILQTGAEVALNDLQ